MKKIALYLLVLCLFSGCFGFVINKHLFGNYYLVACDIEEQLSLTYHEPSDGDSYGTIIDETVFAIGYNENYIIAKQHPRQISEPTGQKTTNFFILPIKKGMDWKTKNGLIGPLTLEQFNTKRKELNIPDELKFTIEQRDLE